MTTTRETLATIADEAARSITPDDLPPIPGEHPATGPTTAALVAAEVAPFAGLAAALGAFFGDELAEALTGPEAPEAEVEIRRIIDEHLRAARTRLVQQCPVIDWSDHVSLYEASHALVRRVGDLRFVAILGGSA
jgi:hypothetical protein